MKMSDPVVQLAFYAGMAVGAVSIIAAIWTLWRDRQEKRPRCSGPTQRGQNKAKIWHAPSSTMPQHFP